MAIDPILWLGIIPVIAGVSVYATGVSNRRRLEAKEAKRIKRNFLTDISMAVSVRESNGSRTTLENLVESELVKRGARVLLANQERSVMMVKSGEYSPLNTEAQLSLVGTLTVRHGCIVPVIVYTEKEFDFNERKAQFEVDLHNWRSQYNPSEHPKPQFEGRQHKALNLPRNVFHFSYKIIGKGGIVIASGVNQATSEAELAGSLEELRGLAESTVESLEELDIWSNIQL